MTTTDNALLEAPQDGVELPPATPARRVSAALIDLLIAAALGILGATASPSWIIGAITVVEFVVLSAISLARTGRTVGHWISRTGVVRDGTAFLPSPSQVCRRIALVALGAILLLIGALILVGASRRDRRGQLVSLLDFLTGTLTIDVASVRKAVPVARGVVVSDESPHTQSIAADTLRSPSVLASKKPSGSSSRDEAAAGRGPALPLEDAPAAQTPVTPQASDPLTPAQVLITTDARQQILLAAPGFAVFGRAPVAPEGFLDAQMVTIDDPDMTVSKTHMYAHVTVNGLVVLDAGSSNGTAFVTAAGAYPLTPEREYEAPHGIRIQLGERQLISSIYQNR